MADQLVFGVQDVFCSHGFQNPMLVGVENALGTQDIYHKDCQACPRHFQDGLALCGGTSRVDLLLHGCQAPWLEYCTDTQIPPAVLGTALTVQRPGEQMGIWTGGLGAWAPPEPCGPRHCVLTRVPSARRSSLVTRLPGKSAERRFDFPLVASSCSEKQTRGKLTSLYLSLSP